jgi:glycosyltransferase domain-containing protein
VKDKVTILIPTHYRPKYLKRLLSFLNHYDLKNIIICDSSHRSFTDIKMFDDCHYFHYPDAAYVDKFNEVLPNITTKYTLLCADDDFIIPSAMLKCVDFLEENDDYSYCHGFSYRFEKKFGTVYFGIKHYDFNNELSDPVQRLFASTSTPYYGVQRTDNLLETFKFLSDKGIKKRNSLTLGYYTDLVMTTFAVIRGKSKGLDIPFGFRGPGRQAFSENTMFADVFDHDVLSFHNEFLKRILTIIGDNKKNREDLVKYFSNSFCNQVLWYNRFDNKVKQEKTTINIREKIREYLAKYDLRKIREYLTKCRLRYQCNKTFKRQGFEQARQYLNTDDVKLMREHILRCETEICSTS